MAAGSIVVDLLLKTGSFETDTQRASKALKQLKADADKIGTGIGLAFTAGTAGLAYLVTSSINAQDHLNDLSKKTGIAADTLGGIGFAAQQSGGDLDSAAAAAGKLNKSLAEAAAGNVEAAAAFKVLGINVRDAAGNTKTADVALAEIADKFAGYADGPEKAALALRLFGKAGADIIPLLDEGGRALQANIEYFKKYSGVTNETAQQADQFNDTLAKLKLLSGAFGKTLAAELLPALQGLADLFLENKEKGDQFRGVAGDLADVLKVAAFSAGAAAIGFITLGRSIGGALAAADAARQFHFEEAFNISKETLADLGVAKDKIAALYEAINKGQQQDDGSNFSHEGRGSKAIKPPAPRLPPAAGTGDDPTKKLLENQLKAIEAAIEREKDLLATRNDFIELYNSQNLLSLKDYYAARKVAQDDAAQGEINGFNQEIAALRAYQANKSTSQVDKAGAEVKITELVGKRAKAEQEAGKQALLLGERERFGQEELAKQFAAVNAQVLDLQENFAGAAAIKFDQQFDVLKKTFSANGNQAGLDAIATLRAAAIAQGAFQKASTDAGRTFDALTRQEDFLNLAQQSGAATTIETMVKLGEARKAQIPLLEAQVQAEEAIAKASGNPGLIANAEAARLSLEKLKATVDPLGDEFRKNFTDSATDSLYDFATGAKSASQAFDSFAKSVLNNILKLGSQSIAESIFGKGGVAGGASGFLSSLFSSKSSGSSEGIGPNGAGGASGGTAGGFLSSIASFFSGFFADGGYVPPNSWAIAGERGPEKVYGGKTGVTVQPNSGGAAPINVVQHFNFSEPPSRQTQSQVGAAALAGAQRALARNG